MNFIWSIGLFIAGIIINIVINRRRFYRRGAGGLQHYKTYGGSVFNTWIERIGKIIAYLMIFLSVVFFFMWLGG